MPSKLKYGHLNLRPLKELILFERIEIGLKTGLNAISRFLIINKKKILMTSSGTMHRETEIVSPSVL